MDVSDSTDDATSEQQPAPVGGKKPRPPASLLKETKMEGKRAKATKGAKSPEKAKKPVPGKPEHAPLKKPHRFHPGTVALREIRKYQKSTEPLSQMAPFERLVRSILAEHKDDFRLSGSSLKALQVSAEDMLTTVMAKAQVINNLTDHDSLRDVEVRHAAGEMGIHLAPNGKMGCSDFKLKRMQRAAARLEAKTAKALAKDM